MCALPNVSGGARPITPLDSTLRIWGRERRPHRAQRDNAHPHLALWGGSSGTTSSCCASQLNLEAESSRRLGKMAGATILCRGVLSCARRERPRTLRNPCG
eukprot:344704-Pyramimonas_sp.AAC.1